jgi:hypothetical protein
MAYVLTLPCQEGSFAFLFALEKNGTLSCSCVVLGLANLHTLLIHVIVFEEAYDVVVLQGERKAPQPQSSIVHH